MPGVDTEADLLTQLAGVLAVGSSAVLPDSDLGKALFARLPKEVQARIKRVADWTKDDVVFDVVLHHGDSDQLREVCQQVANVQAPLSACKGCPKAKPISPWNVW